MRIYVTKKKQEIALVVNKTLTGETGIWFRS
jgi:hypothetical protein